MKAKFWQVAVSILIGIILVTGGVLGLAAGIRHARAVVSYEDITVDEGAVIYLASLHKKDYLHEARENVASADDTQEFWQSEKSEGVSWGEDFKASLEEYIRGLVADAHLYSIHHGYTAEDKLAVGEKNDAILLEYAGGSVAEFNEVAEAHGFDYNDFRDAAALIYKAEKARELMPGQLGEEEYERQLAEALDGVDFKEKYYKIDVVAILAINEYYVR